MDNLDGVRRFVSHGWERGMLAWDSAANVRPAQRFVRYRMDWEIDRGKGLVVGDTPTCVRDR